jgi:sigma-B regulation protein RsbU (phosphoserine phosphatase)
MQSEPLKVLLIEHDEAFARGLSGMLEQARDTVDAVVTVASLDEAITRLGRESFGVVLLEFFLPDGAGLLNITLLKDQAPRIPIIVIGAADDEAIAVQAVHAGAQDYLVKGQLSPRWLLRSIRYTVERHEADQALLAAEQMYRGIFDHLVEGIFQTTPDGRYLLANAALARIYGYTSPDELQQSVTDIGRKLYVAPGRREEFVRIMSEHDTITNFESEIFRKDGSKIWISENCRAIRAAAGRLLYFEGTVEDITARRNAEENVRESEALYHSLVETIPLNIFRKDLQERFTFANQQFCKAILRPLNEIIGRKDEDLFPPELAAKYQRDDAAVMASGRSLDIVEEHQLPEGRKIFVQVVKIPLYNAAGQIMGLQGMFWDISEQKLAEERIRRAQESLRESEALYHSLVDTMPQCIFRKNMAGQYTFANREFCRTIGHTLESVLGKTIYDFLPNNLAQLRQADDRRVMSSGKPFTQIEQNKFQDREDQYLQVLKIPIFDVNGVVVGLQGMFWDITDIKLAEARVRKANTELAHSREELRAKNAQMEEDLKMASEIQLTMLPQQLPTFPRHAAPAQSAFQFTHRYHPSGTVGGDFFSVTALSDTEAAVFICDVAGHGVRSALVTAMIRALVEELRPLAHEPGQFMTKLNSELFTILKHTGTPILTTAFYLVANAATGQMRYTNAGHPKPLHVRRDAGAADPLVNGTKKSQPALGLFEQAAYQTSEVTLSPHDLVMLYTDGLYEVHAANQELYTQDQLTAAVRQRLLAPTTRLFDDVLREVREFAANHQFDDDVCLVGVDYAGVTTGNVAG